ncbi:MULTISPECIES: hypothetical protein [Bacillus]|uniref:Uncharacterized protein n=1 Tax=Bacillus cereus TaxID=1396 RepID=A0A9X6B4J8_BACCE|nr:hypothetical protein [Bacillus cereus]OOR71917.1 hypothetical protein BLX06_27885 [Bacillus cereus]
MTYLSSFYQHTKKDLGNNKGLFLYRISFSPYPQQRQEQQGFPPFKGKNTRHTFIGPHANGRNQYFEINFPSAVKNQMITDANSIFSIKVKKE